MAHLSWGHINVNVSDLDRAVAFYEKLGFRLALPGIPYLALEQEGTGEVSPEAICDALGVPQGSAGRACIMQLGDGFPMLDLTEFDRGAGRKPLENADLGVVRICLASSDLGRDYEELVSAGVEFLSEPKPGHQGMAEIAVCKDPDGTLIELIQLHLDKWQS